MPKLALDDLLAPFSACLHHAVITAFVLIAARTLATPKWLLEVMVAAIVFFDRACVSAFDSKELQIRRCIAAIKKHGGPGRESLLNSLKYSTKNFNAAPAPIQGLLE